MAFYIWFCHLACFLGSFVLSMAILRSFVCRCHTVFCTQHVRSTSLVCLDCWECCCLDAVFYFCFVCGRVSLLPKLVLASKCWYQRYTYRLVLRENETCLYLLRSVRGNVLLTLCFGTRDGTHGHVHARLTLSHCAASPALVYFFELGVF